MFKQHPTYKGIEEDREYSRKLKIVYVLLLIVVIVVPIMTLTMLIKDRIKVNQQILEERASYSEATLFDEIKT